MGEAANIVQYKAGDYLFQEGDPGDYLYIIMKGSVEIIKEGKGVLVELPEGSLLGEMAIVDSGPRSATARCKTDLIANRMSKAEVEKNLAKLPVWVNGLFKTLSSRVRQMNERVSLDNLDDDKLRIMRQVMFVVEKFGKIHNGIIYLNLEFLRQKIFTTLGIPLEKVGRFLDELFMHKLLEHGEKDTVSVKSKQDLETYLKFFEVKNALIKQLNITKISDYIQSDLNDIAMFLSKLCETEGKDTSWGRMIQMDTIQNKFFAERRKMMPVSKLQELTKIKIMFLKKNPYNNFLYAYINTKFLKTFVDFQEMGQRFEPPEPATINPDDSQMVQ